MSFLLAVLAILGRVVFGITALLASTAAFAEPVTLKSEFVDMMRWEHLNRTRPFYVSSAEWVAHCSLFEGAEWREKCAEKRQDALDGEREATALLTRFGLASSVRTRGWIALHLPKDFKDREKHDELDVAWMETLDKLIAGYRSQESDRCMRKYACTVLFNFDHETLALKGLELRIHSH